MTILKIVKEQTPSYAKFLNFLLDNDSHTCMSITSEMENMMTLQITIVSTEYFRNEHDINFFVTVKGSNVYQCCAILLKFHAKIHKDELVVSCFFFSWFIGLELQVFHSSNTVIQFLKELHSVSRGVSLSCEGC